MQISLNPYINNNYSFKAADKKNENQKTSVSQPTRDEILTAKTKKAVSECKYVIFGIFIMYFAMKRNFKINRIKAQENKLTELAKLEVPKVLDMQKIV